MVDFNKLLEAVKDFEDREECPLIIYGIFLNTSGINRDCLDVECINSAQFTEKEEYAETATIIENQMFLEMFLDDLHISKQFENAFNSYMKEGRN